MNGSPEMRERARWGPGQLIRPERTQAVGLVASFGALTFRPRFLVAILRPFFVTDFFAAAVAFLPRPDPIKNSSSERPSLRSAASHRGVAPRPAQVSPRGPRYFGATFMPRSALARSTRPVGRPGRLRPSPSCAIFLCRSRARSVSILSTSLRSSSKADTSMFFKLTAGISTLPGGVDLRAITQKTRLREPEEY
jgi:hypothetical protein